MQVLQSQSKTNTKTHKYQKMKASITINPYLILLFFIFFLSSVAETQSQISIHDLLKSKGLPGGIFPKGVKSYRFEPDSGLLEVRFGQPCLATFEGPVRFERVVRGNLSYGHLLGLQGMTEKELFLWLSVEDIVVDDPSSGVISINLVVVEKFLSFSLFEDPPRCRPLSEGMRMWKMEGRKKGYEDGK